MTEPRPGRPVVLGRYTLYETLASGRVSNIYLGRAAGAAGFGRTVAVKRLHAPLSDYPDFVAMLRDEARLASHVHHPNVVSTLDVDTIGGELLLVMEYVDGEPLADLVEAREGSRAQPPVQVAVAIASGVLQGLHAAHEARGGRGEPLGIVHRDLSPRNILVGTDGLARVADFGLAKAMGKLLATAQLRIKAQLGYMSPEQIEGGEVDRRSDVYSASIVLWELLSGRPLFDAPSEGEIVREILELSIDPPSKYRPEVPPALDGVVLRGLDRDPAKRFATASEMAAALEDAITPATPRVVGEWVRARAGDRISERSHKIAALEKDVPLPPVEGLSSPFEEEELKTSPSLAPAIGEGKIPLDDVVPKRRLAPFATAFAAAAIPIAIFFVLNRKAALPQGAPVVVTPVATNVAARTAAAVPVPALESVTSNVAGAPSLAASQAPAASSELSAKPAARPIRPTAKKPAAAAASSADRGLYSRD